MKTRAMTLLALMASLALGTATAGEAPVRVGKQKAMETIVVTARRPSLVESTPIVVTAPVATPIDFDSLTLTPPAAIPASLVAERPRRELARAETHESRS